jgi:hypothetical protein
VVRATSINGLFFNVCHDGDGTRQAKLM